MSYVEPTRAPASFVFKQKGRWYARVACPQCAVSLRVRLSLGPMVARCNDCAEDVETDVTPVVCVGTA